MKAKWIAAVVLGVAMLGGGHMAFAGPAEQGVAPGRPGARALRAIFARLGELRGELNLTSEQKMRIFAVVQEHRAEIVEKVKLVRDKGRALRDATEADVINERAIRRAAEDMGDALGEGAVLKARIRAQVRPIFTEEQRDAIDECRDDVRDIIDEAIEAFAGQ